MYFKLLGILLLSYHLEKPLRDSICRNFIGLMWLDWIGLEWTWFYWIGLECGLFWMALHSNGQHRTTLNRTSLDSPGLHWARNYAPDWNTPHCTSVGGTGLEWTTALGFYGLWMFRMEIHCNLLAWMGLHLSGRDWTGLDGTALDCYRLCLTSPDCITLHCLGLNWKSPYRIVCIALDFTWKDCSGFRKDRLNHVFFKASARRAYLRQFAFRAYEMQQWKSCKLSLNCSLT